MKSLRHFIGEALEIVESGSLHREGDKVKISKNYGGKRGTVVGHSPSGTHVAVKHGKETKYYDTNDIEKNYSRMRESLDGSGFDSSELDEDTLDRLDEISKKVSEEQLDELSKKTLASYAKKAAFRISTHSYSAAGHDSDKHDHSSTANLRAQAKKKSDHQWDKIRKRGRGHDLAIDKLAREDFESVGIDTSDLSEEQLDELSKKTLGSYVRKAGRDMTSLEKKSAEHRDLADKLSYVSHRTGDNEIRDQLYKAKRHHDDQARKARDKADKRNSGTYLAVKKLTREDFESVGIDVSDLSEEQIDELSKATLASYVKKASASAGVHDRTAGALSMTGKDDDRVMKHGKVARKRHKGISAAADKLAKK